MLAAVRPELPEDPIVEVAPGVHLDVGSTRVADPKGRPLGVIPVIRDVSEAQGRLAVIEKLTAELAEEAVREHLTGLDNLRHLDRAPYAAKAAGRDRVETTVSSARQPAAR